MKLTRSLLCLVTWYLPLIATNSIGSSEKLFAELGSYRKITVAVSERIPFVVLDQNETLMGLDVQILENFAKKFKLQIDYVIVDASLNYVFSNEQEFRKFSMQTNLRYFLRIFSYFQSFSFSTDVLISYIIILFLVKSIYSPVDWTKQS